MDERKIKEHKMKIDQLVKFIKGITKRGETPQKISAHPILVSQEEVEEVDVLRRKDELMDEWTEKVLEQVKAPLNITIDKYIPLVEN